MPTAEITGFDRGFQPAIDYFTQKVNLPTRTWRDLQKGQHARAFVVAGAMKESLLTDLRSAVDGAIAKGESYDTFKRRFKDIVKRHGWQHTGSANWRSRVIWQTNMRTAYAAGRYAQMTVPEVLAYMPYWLYDHTTITNPREQHKAWDNLVLRFDDAFWKTNYPPNGWGCNCRVRPLSERQMRKLKPDGPDIAPAGAAQQVPEEWRYNVGEAAQGRPQVDAALKKLADDTWRPLPGKPYQAFGRPETLPADTPRATPLQLTDKSPDAIRSAWQAAYGAQTTLRDPSGAEIILSERIIEHWLDKPGTRLAGREQYIPLVREVIEDPAEIWINWAVNGSGRIGLRRYYLKTVTLPGGKTLTLIVDAQGGVWVAFNFMVGRGAQAQNRQGLLVWSRP